jgi:hypothetical protein
MELIAGMKRPPVQQGRDASAVASWGDRWPHRHIEQSAGRVVNYPIGANRLGRSKFHK